MNREEAIKHLETYSTTNGSGQTTQAQHEEAKRMAIKALEQEPCRYWQNGKCNGNTEVCEDAISRQAVQDYIAKYLSQYLYNDVREAVEVIDEYIGELPPVTPQPKTGHWIYIGNSEVNGLKICKCSKCNKRDYGSGNYCRNCGAKMVEPQERSDKA